MSIPNPPQPFTGGEPPRCTGCMSGTECINTSSLTCSLRHWYWEQGYQAAMAMVLDLASRHAPDTVINIVRTALHPEKRQ